MNQYKNSKDPKYYVIETVAKYQVTIFGEMHEQKAYLQFLNEIIPDLYHRSGVTCIAMECFPKEMNKKVQKLINAEEYDRELALEIARTQPWTMWGWKGYWDVFETVWKLNKSIPKGQKKMRVVGIDTYWDGPSMALLGVGDNRLKSPIWEKLRILRLSDDILRLIKRDELMARNIEREIIEKGEKGIVWVGANHSFTHYRQPAVRNAKLIREIGRMGFMLHQKYKNQIFQIMLHTRYYSAERYYSEYHGNKSFMTQFIENVMRTRGNSPIGFDLSDSPFAMLRDSNTDYFHFQPKVGFGDIARGYIFLKPIKEIEKCNWMEGYFSKEMLIKNKIFYELFLQSKTDSFQTFPSAKELDDFFLENISK